MGAIFTGPRIASGTAVLAMLIVWSLAVTTAGVPDACAGYGHPGQEGCTYLFVLRHWFEGVIDWIRSDGNDKIIVAFGTGAIAVFTFTLWWSTHRLWQASKKQSADMYASIVEQRRNADAAQKSAEAAALGAKAAQASVAVAQDTEVRELRAYVCNYLVKVDPFLDGENLDRVAFTVRWKNFGKTPGLWCHVFIDARHLNKGKPESDILFEKKDGDKVNAGFIGPDVTMESTGLLIQRRTIDQLAAGEIRFFIRSRAEYGDAFGVSHETSMCVEVMPHYKPERFIKADPEVELFKLRSFGGAAHNYGD
jgi:hypothetical protein